MKQHKSTLLVVLCLTLASHLAFASFPGQYIVKSVTNQANGIQATLQYNGNENTYLKSNNPIIKDLVLVLSEDNYNELGFKIYDSAHLQKVLPYKEPFPYNKVNGNFNKSQIMYSYSVAEVGQPFSIKISRISDGSSIFDSTNQELAFSEKLIQFGSQVRDESLYGLGERNYKFRFEPGQQGIFSFWNQDQPGNLEYGKPGGQTYGHHPMYLRRESGGRFHVGFFRNQYGMQFLYAKNSSIAFKSTGGIIEMKFFLATSKPEESVILYHNYINGWLLHPFWSLGFHQSKWGYGTSQDLVTVQQKYAENNLPIDTIWSDIDYMREYIDFTVDTTRFNISQMQQLMNLNTTLGVHWVPIIDAGISIKQDQYCIDKGCFIKSNQYNGQPLMGCVWPGKVHYPDFNNPEAYEMWYQGLNNLTTQYNLTPSGFWIDMNEYSNFVNGEIPENGNCNNWVSEEQGMHEQLRRAFLGRKPVTGQNPYADLPFNPIGDNTPLDTKTLSLDAYFYNNPDSSLVYYENQTLYHFDFHNMLGFSEGIATNRAMDRMGFKLKFILTRSQMFGSGKYVQEWTGDNLATWEFLQLSISQILDAQLFGIPLSGADICGFGGNTTPELCARWMTLGTLYPFARNHNSEGDIPQEPYAFPGTPYVLEASRKGLQLRYSLLKHYYHLFIKKGGFGTIINPLFFEFPNDTNLLAIEDEFFIGDSLLVAPIVTQGDASNAYTQRKVIFPAGQLFFDYFHGYYYNQSMIPIVVAFDDFIPLYILGGKILGSQDVEGVQRSRELSNQFTLRVALLPNQTASGTILSLDNYNSDGNVIDKCVQHNCVVNVSATGKQSGTKYVLTVKFSKSQSGTIFDNIQINKFVIYGLIYNGQKQFIRQTLSDPIQLTQELTYYLTLTF